VDNKDQRHVANKQFIVLLETAQRTSKPGFHRNSRRCSTDSVLNSHDTDLKFNTFLNIFLRLFEASFPTKTQKKVFENNEWIIKGIKTFCRHKRELYLNCRSSDNQ
jgi:hypothetical protein